MKTLFVILITGLSMGWLTGGCVQPTASEAVRIVLIDSFSARRTYPVTDSLSNDAVAAINAHPVLTVPPFLSPYLRERLELVGLLRGDSLVVSNFTVADTVYLDMDTASTLVWQPCDSGHCPVLSLTVTVKGRKGVLNIPRLPGEQFSISFASIVDGGLVELMVLKQWYIANGDNFDVSIYEIRP